MLCVLFQGRKKPKEDLTVSDLCPMHLHLAPFCTNCALVGTLWISNLCKNIIIVNGYSIQVVSCLCGAASFTASTVTFNSTPCAPYYIRICTYVHNTPKVLPYGHFVYCTCLTGNYYYSKLDLFHWPYITTNSFVTLMHSFIVSTHCVNNHPPQRD